MLLKEASTTTSKHFLKYSSIAVNGLIFLPYIGESLPKFKAYLWFIFLAFLLHIQNPKALGGK
jgi:hypothetical protein